MKVEKGAQAFPETIRGWSGRDIGSAATLRKEVGDGTSIPVTRLDKLIISKDFRQNLANFRFGSRHLILWLFWRNIPHFILYNEGKPGNSGLNYQ